MWNSRESIGQRMNNSNNINGAAGGGERCIAVAVDKDKSSQYALRWALDHVVTRDETLRLVHVKERIPSPRPLPPACKESLTKDQQIDTNTMELLLPFRCFCRRRQVQCETVVLEDVDVAKALIEYVCQHGVDTLFLGSTSRNGLTRLFKGSDIPASVLKWAPDFCSVYVISKGKINTVRTATRPVPTLPANAHRAAYIINIYGRVTYLTYKKFDRGYDRWYDEMTAAADVDNQISCSGRPSTDSNFVNFYENLGGGCESPRKSNMDGRFFESPFRTNSVDHVDSEPEYNETAGTNERTSWSSFNNLDIYEDEMRRLRTELKQTIDMYHAACKEALVSKQKSCELEDRKKKEDKKLQEENEVEHNATTMDEKTICNVGFGAAETVQKLVEMEVQKRLNAEMKSLKQKEEKHKVLESLSQSHIVLKYQSLFHMIAVLLLVDLERYERPPSKPYIRLSSNTAFHRILYVSMRSSMEFCLLTLN
ncbi:U-box domain-containing protein 51 [Mercurialis annua]|uniref:U-box domain-containing protein 51 n=1 Tax=Mercurialis annua TaxID=3986 RepID=UPI002160E39A|nr:U-box domain-containing protein 51 [Mercurialis annua]